MLKPFDIQALELEWTCSGVKSLSGAESLVGRKHGQASRVERSTYRKDRTGGECRRGDFSV